MVKAQDPPVGRVVFESGVSRRLPWSYDVAGAPGEWVGVWGVSREDVAETSGVTTRVKTNPLAEAVHVVLGR